MPFTDNAVIDEANATTKIWKIFSDGSFGSSLRLQFSFLSSSHFPTSLNLVLDGCRILKFLNVSHQFELPPNRAITVDINVTVPLYLERDQEKCEGKNLEFPLKNGAI
jgi:hypothetical protein